MSSIRHQHPDDRDQALHDPVHLIGAELGNPAKRNTAIGATLRFSNPRTLLLIDGGASMSVDGVATNEPEESAIAGEHRRLFAKMADLLAGGMIDIDRAPMRPVADTVTLGSRAMVALFDL